MYMPYPTMDMAIFYPVIMVKISFAKVMTTQHARVRNPLALWDVSWESNLHRYRNPA